MNNDYIGNTDKLMTGNFSLGYLKDSWALYYSHRLFTPATKASYGDDNYETPMGIYADVMSLNFFKTMPINTWNFDLGIGWDHLANNGARSLSRGIHNRIGSPNIDHKQGLKKGDFINYNLQLSHELFKTKSLIGGGGVRDDFFMTDSYLFIKYLTKFSDYEFSVAQYFIWQNSSLVHERTYRKESTLGIGIGKYYRIYLHYVSSYIHKDRKGQIYLSPLNFQYEW